MVKINKKFIFLLSCNPTPRISRRIKSIFKIISDIFLVYWDRAKELRTIPSDINIKVKKIDISCSKNFLERILLDIKLFFISYNILRKENPYTLYIEGLDMLIVGCIYKLLHRSVKIMYEVSDIPGGQFEKNRIAKWLINLSNKFLLRKVNLLILTSPSYWKEYYRYKYPSQNKIIIENFPEKAVFNNFKPVEHEGLTIGFIGSVRYRDQIINLLESCKGLQNVQIIIAGGGPYYPYIRKISSKYSNVLVTGPFNYEKDIKSLYAKIDLLYCVYDTSLLNVRMAIPNKLYESIICSVPIIVAKNTKLSQIVKKYSVGFEVSDNDPEETRKLIINILNNPDLLDCCKKNAEQIKEKFYFEKVEKFFLSKLKKFYNIIA